MRSKRHLSVAGAILSALALCTLLALPVQAAHANVQTATRTASATIINANVYLTAQMLQPIFQSNINQQMPQMMGNAIASMVNQLPQQDQGWASQMAGALLQPSATLIGLKPEGSGLLATFKINLYPGDPKATTTSLLIGFKVINGSTIQVTALPTANGESSLVSGPLTTFRVPIGTLNSIVTTPHCGDADLSINLKFPLALGASGTASHQGAMSTTAISYTRPAVSSPTAYVEIPSASLAQLGSSIGSIPVSSSLTAENIRVGVSGSDLTATSDIYWHGIIIGTAVSTMVPEAVSGNLAVHVLKTDLSILGGLISFPLNSYNTQIEQMLNGKLNGALAGKFTVTQAAVGSNPKLTCVKSDSLILGGTIALG
jgi:hypothetical protein